LGAQEVGRQRAATAAATDGSMSAKIGLDRISSRWRGLRTSETGAGAVTRAGSGSCHGGRGGETRATRARHDARR
jgi:hypothetical protein